MAPHLHETRQPSPSPDVLQLKSANGPPKPRFGNLPPIRPGHAQSGQFFGKPVFRNDHFPDDIAIANMIQRYWAPFHDTINKIINTGSLRLILECHTMMAVGPKMSRDPGKPRPLFMIEHLVREKEMSRETCSTGMAGGLMEQVEKSFAGEKNTITEKFVISDTPADGFIMKSYGNRGIPMLRVSLAQSLFLNDAHFSYDYLRVDDLRIQHIRKSMRESIERFCHKCL